MSANIKIIFFLFLFYLLSFKLISSLRKSEFCNLVEKECVGRLDANRTYQVVCHYQKCPNSFISCGSEDMCVSNKKECEEYLMMNIYLDPTLYTEDMPPSLKLILKVMKKNFDRFRKEIAHCPKREYTWKASDMCFAGSGCYRKEFIANSEFSWFWMISYKNYELKRVDCPCNEKNTYICGKDYCSINKQG